MIDYSAAAVLDRHGYESTWIHRRDPRVKIIAAAAFVLAVVSVPQNAPAALLPYALIPLAWGSVGRVPAGPLLRLLSTAAALALLVAVGELLTSGQPLVRLWPGITVRAGWLPFLSIVERLVLTAAIVLVLIATTSMPGIAGGLLRMRVPRPFVAQIQFVYRYLFLLVEQATAVNRARQLRDATGVPRLRTAAGMLVSLFVRSRQRAERTYQCMKARGFEGQMPDSREMKLGAEDFLLLGLLSIVIWLLSCISLQLARLGQLSFIGG